MSGLGAIRHSSSIHDPNTTTVTPIVERMRITAPSTHDLLGVGVGLAGSRPLHREGPGCGPPPPG